MDRYYKKWGYAAYAYKDGDLPEEEDGEEKFKPYLPVVELDLEEGDEVPSNAHTLVEFAKIYPNCFGLAVIDDQMADVGEWLDFDRQSGTDNKTSDGVDQPVNKSSAGLGTTMRLTCM